MPNAVQRKLTREAILTGKLIPGVLTIQNFPIFIFANPDHAGLECLLRAVANLQVQGQKDRTVCLNVHERNTKTHIAISRSSGSLAVRK